MYKTISSDENIMNPAYGIGFYFSMINAMLFCLLIPAVYLMISSDGVIQDKPRPKSRQVRSMMFDSKSMGTMSSYSSKISPSYGQRSYGDTMRSDTSYSTSSYSQVSKNSLPTLDSRKDYTIDSRKDYTLDSRKDYMPSKLVSASDRTRKAPLKELPIIPQRTFKSAGNNSQGTLRIKTESSRELVAPDKTRRARTTGARTADEARQNRKGAERKQVGRNASAREMKSAPERDIELVTFERGTMSDFDNFLKSFD